MRAKIIIPLLILSFSLVGCERLDKEVSPEPNVFSPYVIEESEFVKKELSSLSDISKSGDHLYFLEKSGDVVALKKKDIDDKNEEVVDTFEYQNEIIDFSLSSDESWFAFLGKEEDKLIFYTSESEGGTLNEVLDYDLFRATPGGDMDRSDSMVLKRVGLENAFFFTTKASLECAGMVWSEAYSAIALECDEEMEITPENEVLFIKYGSDDHSFLMKKNYLTFNGEALEDDRDEELIKLPFSNKKIENIELVDENTVRIITDMQYVDVRFKE